MSTCWLHRMSRLVENNFFDIHAFPNIRQFGTLQNHRPGPIPAIAFPAAVATGRVAGSASMRERP